MTSIGAVQYQNNIYCSQSPECGKGFSHNYHHSLQKHRRHKMRQTISRTHVYSEIILHTPRNEKDIKKWEYTSFHVVIILLFNCDRKVQHEYLEQHQILCIKKNKFFVFCKQRS